MGDTAELSAVAIFRIALRGCLKRPRTKVDGRETMSHAAAAISSDECGGRDRGVEEAAVKRNNRLYAKETNARTR